MSNEHIFMPEDHMDALYNSKNPMVRFVHRQRLELIAKNIRGKKILDAGCGEGHLILEMQKHHKADYFGVDITDVALEKARKKCKANFSNQDLTKMNFKDETFDCITCSEVLEHIYGYKKVLKELKRVLKKNGLLIITFPNETNWTISRFLLRRKPVKVPDHVNSFSPNQMKKDVGLSVYKRFNMPFGLPFFSSLGSMMVFKK